MNVYLIGYRGTGKSTLAPLLAARLGEGWRALDLDERIESAAGCTIAELFAAEGESGFRDREEAALAAVPEERCVVATGGGIIERARNRDRLRAGFVVWLEARPEEIHRRLGSDPATAMRRPNLTPSGGLEEIRALLARRAPVYRQLANLLLDTESAALPPLADIVVQEYNKHLRAAHLRQREASCC